MQDLTPILRRKGLSRSGVIARTCSNACKQSGAASYAQKDWTIARGCGTGAVNDDVVLQTRQEYLKGLADIDEAESQLKQLDIKEADALRQYLESLNTIKNLKPSCENWTVRKQVRLNKT